MAKKAILKAIEESDTGLNTMFIDEVTHRKNSLDFVISQINKGNPRYERYETVIKKNGTIYVRSIADNNKSNNIENK